MAIKTCLFDLGNVLVFFSHERMCRQVAEVVGRSESEVRSALLESGLQLRFECGESAVAEVHRELDRHFGTKTQLTDFEHAASQIFELNAPMVPLIDELKSAGIRLVLLSNTCSSHFKHVRDTFDLLDRFDDFTLSYEAGAVKPSRRIYEAAIAKIQCEPAECFYTDDIAEYVYAARDFAIDAEVFQDAAGTRDQLARRGAIG